MATETHESPHSEAPPPAQSWRMQTPDGAVYGPVPLLTLCTWAMDARVTPGCRVSRDGQAWRAAETLSLLGLEWNLVLESGAQYGPLHFLAVHELAREIPGGVQAWLVHRPSGERWPYAGPLAAATVREFRERLASHMREVGRMAADGDPAALRSAMEERDRLRAEEQALRSAHEADLRRLTAELAGVTQQLSVAESGWLARISQAEKDSAAALAQAQAEGRAQLAAALEQLRQLGDRLAAGDAERAQLAARLKAQEAQRIAADTQCAAALAEIQSLRAEMDLARRQARAEADKLRDAAAARDADAQKAEQTLRTEIDQAQHELSAVRAQLIQREAHLAEVLREHEAREAAWRRQSEAQAAAPPAAAPERVIEVEYERHDSSSEGPDWSANGAAGDPPRMAPRDVLAGLEARLQSELAAWEQMNQTKKRR